MKCGLVYATVLKREAGLYRLLLNGMLRKIVLTLLPLLFITTPVFAQVSYREFERGLNLSDSQRNQMEGIKQKYMNELRGLKDESVKKRIELNEIQRNRRHSAGRERVGKEDRLERDLYHIEQSRERLYRRYKDEVSGVFNEEQRGRYNDFVTKERRDLMRPPVRHRGHDR
jgi:hypothetical protein